VKAEVVSTEGVHEQGRGEETRKIKDLLVGGDEKEENDRREGCSVGRGINFPANRRRRGDRAREGRIDGQKKIHEKWLLKKNGRRNLAP